MDPFSQSMSSDAKLSRPTGDAARLPLRRETPKEAAVRKKAEQQEDLRHLDNGALYIMLLVREGSPNNFHWCLYHHFNKDDGGYKYHIIGTPGQAQSWYPEHGVTYDAMSSNRLIGLVRIAKDLGGQAKQVRDIITSRDGMLSEIPGLTCRVYVEVACKALKEHGFVNSRDWTELQSEVMGFGNSQNEIVLQAYRRQEHAKPRPVLISQSAI